MGRYPHLVVIGTGLTFGYLVVRWLFFKFENLLAFLFLFLLIRTNCLFLCHVFFGAHFSSWLASTGVIIIG